MPMQSIASSCTTKDPGPTIQPKPALAVGSAATKGTAGATRPLQKVSIPRWTGAKTLRCQDATVVTLEAACGAYSSMWDACIFVTDKNHMVVRTSSSKNVLSVFQKWISSSTSASGAARGTHPTGVQSNQLRDERCSRLSRTRRAR